MGGQVGAHELDLLAILVLLRVGMLADILDAGLSPEALVSGLGRLWSA
jgi:hypothetical protein